jgi:hypothetical protein
MLSELVYSTTATLGGGVAYTSRITELDAYDEIVASCYSDVAGSLAIQQSNDGTNWDVVKTIAYAAAGVAPVAVPIVAKYGRVVYTNGGVAQAAFRLFVAKKKGADFSTDLNTLLADLAIAKAQGGLTTFGEEAVLATDVNGVTWKTLLDKSTITGPTEIWGFKATKGGVWAGNSKIRIVTAAAVKIWPFGAEAVEGTDFVDGVDVDFPAPVSVPVASGYIVQFRSSDAGDGAGETAALTVYAVTRS